MVTLALTGGIGSGKSYVRRVFSAMGIPVYDTDGRVKELYDLSDELKEKISSEFGSALFIGQKLDRKALAKRVFSDTTALRTLEHMVYPILLKNMKQWKMECESAGNRCVLIESALILEKECFADVADVVITVSSPVQLRMERAMFRDGCSAEEVTARMENQHSDRWREQRSDHVIVSDGKTPLIPQIVRILSSEVGGN